MGQFFQKFAARIISGPARPPMLAISIFGKHPGWDDHMEDVGHQFPEMLAFKRMLYVEGIGGSGNKQRKERFGLNTGENGIGLLLASLRQGSQAGKR